MGSESTLECFLYFSANSHSTNYSSQHVLGSACTLTELNRFTRSFFIYKFEALILLYVIFFFSPLYFYQMSKAALSLQDIYLTAVAQVFILIRNEASPHLQQFILLFSAKIQPYRNPSKLLRAC